MIPDARLDDETEQGIEDRARCYSFRVLTIEAAEVAQREAIDAYRQSLVAKVEAQFEDFAAGALVGSHLHRDVLSILGEGSKP